MCHFVFSFIIGHNLIVFYTKSYNSLPINVSTLFTFTPKLILSLTESKFILVLPGPLINTDMEEIHLGIILTFRHV